MKLSHINRRRFLRALLYGVPTLAAANALWLKPAWISTRWVTERIPRSEVI